MVGQPLIKQSLVEPLLVGHILVGHILADCIVTGEPHRIVELVEHSRLGLVDGTVGIAYTGEHMGHVGVTLGFGVVLIR